MKTLKIMMMALMMCFTGISFGQTRFQFEFMDSTSKSKSELYTLNKMFIGETWKSSQNVINVDDKDGGVILVKGLSIQNLYFQMNDHRYTFRYSIKFLFKDNKYKMIISDVYCESARAGIYDWPLLPMDGYPENGYRKLSLNEERYNTIIKGVHDELLNLLNLYKLYSKSYINDSNW
jgi:hypothetical protein